MNKQVLLCDMGTGPYVKMALCMPGQRPKSSTHFGCTNEAQFDHAIHDFLEMHANPKLSGMALSASGWEEDGALNLVHFGFNKTRQDLRDLTAVSRVNIVNDFVAKALSVPVLSRNYIEQVLGGLEIADQVTAVMGPAQGFGCAFLMPDGLGGWVANHCEGGHASFSPNNALEIEILKILMTRFGHVSYERIVSNLGPSHLWQALDEIEGPVAHTPSLEEIIYLAKEGDERALRVMHIFTEVFATAASDMAVMQGARGGIYLVGEVLDLMGSLFDYRVFANRFYNKGRVSGFLKEIPVYRVREPEPEFLGLSTLFEAA